MGAPTEYYVDPSLGSDTGDGTVGTPWGRASGSVIQHALNTITQNATHGDRINVKAGADDVCAADISLASYGTPSYTNPLRIQGYTTAAGDGGIGVLDFNASYKLNATAGSGFQLQDMDFHNSAQTTAVTLPSWCNVASCHFYNMTTNALRMGANSYVLGSRFEDIGGNGVTFEGSSQAAGGCIGNYFKNGTKGFTNAIYSTNYSDQIRENIISVDGTSNGINVGFFWIVSNNSVYSTSGSGKGITCSQHHLRALNNLVEGFSTGIDYGGDAGVSGHNACYNSTTNYSTDTVLTDLGDNEVTSVSPFDKSGADTFANRFTYFAPVDTGNVHGGSFPSGSRRDKGAVQHGDTVSGGRLVNGGLVN